MNETKKRWLLPVFIGSLLLNGTLLVVLLVSQPALERYVEVLIPVAIPLAVAFIAWYGVRNNIESSREQELLNQWHSNVRWATDLTLSSNDQHVATGIAALDSLDDLPFLGDEENKLIDAIVESTAARYADIYES